MEKKYTRKEFFKESAKYAAGISAGVVGLNTLSSKKVFGKTSWPWPYTALDVEAVRILGHDSYWSGKGCCYGAFHAIIKSLENAIGSPYTDFPTELMIYGHGGGAGWGTVCGAINGAAAAISLVCTKADSDVLVSELFGWYTQTLFPTDISNQYAANGNFNVNNYTGNLVQNASGSPLCHVSVTNWCNTANIQVNAVERKERCARLTGDVAAYAVKILNDQYAGTFTPLYVPPASIATCMSCHGSTGMNKVAAKMECQQCHGDPHGMVVEEDLQPIPSHYGIQQNYPNPFNPNTTIEFSLPKSEQVTLSIYDLNGRHIKTLINKKNYGAGTHRVQWDGTDALGQRVGSGMYFYQIRAGKFMKTKSMLMVK
ncbi:MAG: hypothetical protein Kow0042_08390 [Calditrichia bacterium]